MGNLELAPDGTAVRFSYFVQKRVRGSRVPLAATMRTPSTIRPQALEPPLLTSSTIRPAAIFAPLLALALVLAALLTLPARTLAQPHREGCSPATTAKTRLARGARLCTPRSRSAAKDKIKAKTHAKRHKHSAAHKRHLGKGHLPPVCEEEGLLPAEACGAGQEAPSCEECEAASNGVSGPASGTQSVCEDGSFPIVEGPGEVSCDDGSEPACPTAGPNVSSPQAFVGSIVACMANLGHEGPEYEGAA